MFGTNPIVGKAFFKSAPARSLMVTSIFYTLQGEGPYSGLPCVFVRLSKCNLNCSFCDTQFEQGEYLTFDQIKARAYKAVCDYWNTQGKPAPLWVLPKSPDSETEKLRMNLGLVVTGGEPSLQKNLKEFFEEMRPVFDWMQIETNGITPLKEMSPAVTLVCSPKCSQQPGKASKYLKPNSLTLHKADALKFVMSSDPESPYSSIPSWAFEWAEKRLGLIYVSPMNVYKAMPQKMRLFLGKEDKSMAERSTVDEVVSFWEPGVLDMEANRKNHEYAARYALEHGLRFQVQTHLLASLA